jgi:hypothetical protein
MVVLMRSHGEWKLGSWIWAWAFSRECLTFGACPSSAPFPCSKLPAMRELLLICSVGIYLPVCERIAYQLSLRGESNNLESRIERVSETSQGVVDWVPDWHGQACFPHRLTRQFPQYLAMPIERSYRPGLISHCQ